MGQTFTYNKKAAANIHLPQWGLTWLIHVQCFYQHLCLVDSFVLLNPPLRQVPKCSNKTATIVENLYF